MEHQGGESVKIKITKRIGKQKAKMDKGLYLVYVNDYGNASFLAISKDEAKGVILNVGKSGGF